MAADMETALGAIEKVNRAFTEFKQANDQRIEALGRQLDEHASRLNVTERFRSSRGTDQDDLASPAWFPSMRQYHEARMQTSIDPAGGYLVDVGVSSRFMDRLRPASVVLSAGPLVMPMGQADRLKLPKLASSTTVVNAGEGTNFTSSDASLQVVELVARKFGVRSIGTSEWLADSNPGGLTIIERDHNLQLGARLDLDMLEGTGAMGLVGLRNWPGVTSTALGAGNGAAPTLDDVIDAIERLESANASATAIFMHPRTWKVLRKLLDSQDRYQLTPDPSQDAVRRLFGVPVYLSSQISITETTGSSSDCSYILVADMSRVVVSPRAQAEILIDPYTLSSTGQVAILTVSRYGFGVLDEEAVEVITGVRQ